MKHVNTPSLEPADICRMEMDMTVSRQETQPHAWDAMKCMQLHAELCKYRDRLCIEATDSDGQSIPLLFGLVQV